MAPRIIWLVLVILHNYYYRSFLVLVLVISLFLKTKSAWMSPKGLKLPLSAIFIFSKFVKCMRLRLRSKLPRSFSSPSAVWRDLSLSEIELVKICHHHWNHYHQNDFLSSSPIITIITIYRVIIILIIIKFYIHFSEWWWWLSLKAVSFHVCSCCLLSTETLIKYVKILVLLISWFCTSMSVSTVA